MVDFRHDYNYYIARVNYPQFLLHFLGDFFASCCNESGEVVPCKLVKVMKGTLCLDCMRCVLTAVYPTKTD